MNSRERRPSLWSNATRAMPLCEALSSRRGLGPHHAQMDRVGTWDISRLAVSWLGRRSASGRRGAVADDARAREVGLCHSSWEADEQSGAICCGVGEPRAETKGNAGQQHTRRTQRRISVSQMLARIRQQIVAVDTQGGNRMRESCTYGSVRGVRGNSRPYRENMSPNGR
jgi:hypothetical protein